MKKTVFVVMLIVLGCVSASAQLLYKISGNDLERPSYIIGTHHLANVAFVEKINGVKQALTETDQVYGELNFDAITSPDSLKLMQEAMKLPQGTTLKSLLSADEYKRLDSFLTNKMGAGLSNPMVAAQMGNMTPMAMTETLQQLIFLTRHMGEFDPTNTFDGYFQTQAKANNEYVGGLETMRQQIDVLFNSQSLERQKVLLMCLIDNEQVYLDMMEQMTAAFYAQDIEAISKAMDIKLNNACDSTPEEDEVLIGRRNANWMEKMPAIMRGKPTFFAVGAGHLPGEKGLLQLLKSAGYTVEGVN